MNFLNYVKCFIGNSIESKLIAKTITSRKLCGKGKSSFHRFASHEDSRFCFAAGLCVDYVSHSGHSYKRSVGADSRQRAHAALEAMGVPLVNAAVSSLLGIVMLAFSSSYGMRTLFITALFLFSFSFFYGVFVLPVLLRHVVCKCKHRSGKISRNWRK